MFSFRRFLSCALLLALAGCTPYFGLPTPQENGGGFTVLVDVPGQPASARVVADVGAFVQRRGFVRDGTGTATRSNPAAQPPPAPAPERYRLGKITLDVVYQPAHLRVVAYLHTFSHQLNGRFVDDFYRDFSREYAARYGDEGTIIENDYEDGVGSTPRGGGGRGKGGGHGNGGGNPDGGSGPGGGGSF